MLLEPDVNLSSASFTVRTSSESENESDAESSSENKDHNWLTCAGELSYLVEDLKRASELVDEVKSDTCPAIETFLTNAEELTQQICNNANEIRKMSSALLKEMEEEKRAAAPNDEEIVLSVPSHDPGERYKVNSLTEKKYIIKLGPHQPKLSVFPQHEDIPQRKQCRFSSVWYASFPHREYGISKDAAFCHVFIIFIRTWHGACRCSMVYRWYATMAQNDQSRN